MRTVTTVGTGHSISEGLTRLLLLIDDTGVPVGSRQLVRQMDEQGMTWSEATMARRLRELDARGLTRKVGSKGRVSTPTGRGLASSVRRGERSAEQLRRASTIRTAEDVLHLLQARRAIEPEGVRGATETLSGQLDPRLTELVERHRSAAGADGPIPRDLVLGFHREFARLSPNPIVRAMLDTVLSKEMDAVEATLDAVLEARHHAAKSVTEHEHIVDAMAAGDADRAAALMQEHLDRLLSEVVSFLAENDPGLIERMLELSARA